MGENEDLGDEVEGCHIRAASLRVGDYSAAPVPSAKKWSHEAIVARSNMRPEHMQKLKVAANSGQNPSVRG